MILFTRSYTWTFIFSGTNQDSGWEKTLSGFPRTVKLFYAWQITQIEWEGPEDKSHPKRPQQTKAPLLMYSLPSLPSAPQLLSPTAFFFLILFLVCWASRTPVLSKTQAYFGFLSHSNMSSVGITLAPDQQDVQRLFCSLLGNTQFGIHWKLPTD